MGLRVLRPDGEPEFVVIDHTKISQFKLNKIINGVKAAGGPKDLSRYTIANGNFVVIRKPKAEAAA